MPDGLYESDILSWSQRQAELLRRLARGERVNEVDWEHVVGEIEDVGISELHAVESFLSLMVVHLLRVHGWPLSSSAQHWRSEIVAFQQNASRRFAPSMRQRLDVARLYADALEQLHGLTSDGAEALPWPGSCPWSLDDLLTDKRDSLLQRLVDASGTGPQ